MIDINRRYLLAERPTGLAIAGALRLDMASPPEPGEGEFVVRNEWISLDPAMRGWMSPGRSYIDPVEIGTVMRAFAAGTVVASRHADYPVGCKVAGLFGMQDYALSDGDPRGGTVRRAIDGVPLSAMLGILGLTGLTAYFGLLEIGQPRGGETVVVSAAAGAVGSAVVQIARIMGCRVVGIAGGPEKCAFVNELGADGCIDYKAEDVPGQLKRLCPQGIDIFFDNVGGDILDAVLRRINVGARVVLCGGISQYGAAVPKGPSAYLSLLANRARMEGFIYFDFFDRFDAAEAALAAWFRRGWLRHQEEIVDGLGAAPGALSMLFDGANKGKLLVRVGSEAL